jgi:ribosome-associated protein
MDYGDFIVHIFSETARSYYDLERLWRHGKILDPAAAATA